MADLEIDHQGSGDCRRPKAVSRIPFEMSPDWSAHLSIAPRLLVKANHLATCVLIAVCFTFFGAFLERQNSPNRAFWNVINDKLITPADSETSLAIAEIRKGLKTRQSYEQ